MPPCWAPVNIPWDLLTPALQRFQRKCPKKFRTSPKDLAQFRQDDNSERMEVTPHQERGKSRVPFPTGQSRYFMVGKGNLNFITDPFPLEQTPKDNFAHFRYSWEFNQIQRLLWFFHRNFRWTPGFYWFLRTAFEYHMGGGSFPLPQVVTLTEAMQLLRQSSDQPLLQA